MFYILQVEQDPPACDIPSVRSSVSMAIVNRIARDFVVAYGNGQVTDLQNEIK